MIAALYANNSWNRLSEQDALRKELVGMQIYEEPLLGIGSAEDDLFEKFLKPEIIGPWFKQPKEWLPGARTVISLFFPFTEAVRSSNRHRKEEPSAEWLHGRIEGQVFLQKLAGQLKEQLEAQGIAVCVPMIDPRFEAVHNGNKFHEYGCVNERTFGSNWSERHAAFVCGLGTFGLSKGLITQRGMAGRFVSLIIDEPMEADKRPYTEVYEYCSQCGACARRCPAQAIDPEKGKDHIICRAWLIKMSEKYTPRYGCGLCQTDVPCEYSIPKKSR